MVSDGYGIGYGMDKSYMRFNVTTFKPLEPAPFLKALDESLHEMKKAATAGAEKLVKAKDAKKKTESSSAH